MTPGANTLRLRIVRDSAPEPAPPPPPEIAPPAAAPAEEPARSLSGRLFAIGLLVGTLAGLGWIAGQIYYVISDSWVAPLHLSPDNDAIAQLRVQREHQLAELSRLDAEVARLDGEIGAIDGAVARLARLRGSAKATLSWQEKQGRVEQKAIGATAQLLERQRATIGKLRDRQRSLLARARDELRAGLVDVATVEREQLAADRLALELDGLQRELAELALRRSQNRTSLAALGTPGGSSDGAQMPEVAAGDEHTARVEVEIERLNAEARGYRALRNAAVASAANQRSLLAELEARPLYRAMSKATDVAFVPYDQLEGVHAGSRVLDCTWGLFHCRPVGRVAEVMPGEVVTQDPWGEMARGQYVVLAIDDPKAVRERVLRVRD